MAIQSFFKWKIGFMQEDLATTLGVTSQTTIHAIE